MTSRYPRYAVYYTPPPASRWWRFGCGWLGRDPITGARRAAPRVAGLSAAEIEALTETPRRYGFHATLKAPFALAAGAARADLERAAADFAQRQPPVDLGPLRLLELDGFLALCPETTPAIRALAQRCIEAFDALRAPPDDAELARRRAAGLTPRQEALLRRWGYPYVAEEYRLHFTLTGRLAPARLEAARAALLPALEALADEPLALDALSLFEQPAAETPFRLLARYGFDGSVARYDGGAARGRLYYVVGPSGAGKDTLLDYARARLAEHAAVVFAHRYITRPPQAGGENHVALSAAEFARRERAGAFALRWDSHGCRYGIGVEIDHWLAQGLDVVVNGSRAYLAQARARYPDMAVVWIHAPPEVLRRRLERRGRESGAARALRLARAEAYAPPAGIPVVEIVNDGALADAGERLLRLLRRRQ